MIKIMECNSVTDKQIMSQKMMDAAKFIEEVIELMNQYPHCNEISMELMECSKRVRSLNRRFRRK